MGFQVDTELMENQKHAVVMAPDKKFEVLQTPGGHSLLFSVGTDNRLWVCQEIPNKKHKTGWLKTDLSKSLWQKHSNPAVTHFALSQNKDATTCDIILALRVEKNDLLYISLNIPNTEDAWKNGINWTHIAFDAINNGTPVNPPNPFQVSGLFVEHMPAAARDTAPQNIFVDIIHDIKNPFKTIDRYWISPNTTPHWNQHNLPIDLSAGTISTCLGTRRADLHVPGIYTLGKLGSSPALVYSTQWNPDDRRVAGISVILEKTPRDRTAIASAFDNNGYTNLFVSSPAGLYLFTAGKQKATDAPKLIVDAKNLPDETIFKDVSQMSAMLILGQTFVWCKNDNGDLFYTSCHKGSEDDPSKWTVPMPICRKVEGYAFYINATNTNNTLFAHIQGNQLYKFTQNAVTTAWTKTEILLPPTNVNDISRYKSLTTQIKYTDDNATGISAAEISITVKAVSHVVVYINDVYHVLSPDRPISVKTRHRGCLDIVQPTSSLSAVCYYIWLTGADESERYLIRPLDNAYGKLETVKDGSDLDFDISNEHGVTRPLIPERPKSGEQNETAKAVAKLCTIHKTLPDDGSPKKKNSTQPHAITLGLDIGLKTLAGDLFHWLDEAAHLVDHYYTTAVEEGFAFVAHIGKKVFHTILNCASAVAGAVKFVFNKIKVGIENLIAWLGFLFIWPKILRTHTALKNVLGAYLSHMTTEIHDLEDKVHKAFENIEEKWASWTGLSGPSSTIGTSKSGVSDVKKSHSPQSSWALNHFSNGQGDASTSYTPHKVQGDGLEALLKDLVNFAKDEGKIVEGVYHDVRTDIIDQINTLSPMALVTKLVGIIGEGILKSAENVVLELLHICKIIAQDVNDLLKETLHIPIISQIYQEFAKAPLSILDVICLIGAIPVTIIFTAMDIDPFPSGSPLLKKNMTFDEVSNVFFPPSQRHKPARRHKSLKEAVANQSWVDIVQVAFNMSTYFTAGAWVFLSDLKFALLMDRATVPDMFGYLFIPCYFFLITPNLPPLFALKSDGPDIFNDVVTIICMLKTSADNLPAFLEFIEDVISEDAWNDLVSPIADIVLNFIWLGPAIWSLIESHDKASSDVAFAANVCFDVGSMIAPIGVFLKKSQPEIALLLFAGGTQMNMFYGALEVVSGALIVAGK